MSIATQIQNYNDGLLGAYNAVNTKGGTVPANKNLANLPSAINSISGGGGGITERMASTLEMLAQRHVGTYKELFPYDNVSYGVIDLSTYDDFDNGSHRIKDIGQRVLNSFTGNSNEIRVKMPAYLERISGANWTGATRVKYYDFSGYKRNTVPTYSSSTADLGNSNARVLVPASLETAWKSATGWSGFSTQIIGVSEEYD